VLLFSIVKTALIQFRAVVEKENKRWRDCTFRFGSQSVVAYLQHVKISDLRNALISKLYVGE